VHLLAPADTFPYGANTTRAMQIDHTNAWTRQRSAAGLRQSHIGNYARMIGLHHRIKTHRRWHCGETPTSPPTSSTTPAPDDYPTPSSHLRHEHRPRRQESPLEARIRDLVLAN